MPALLFQPNHGAYSSTVRTLVGGEQCANNSSNACDNSSCSSACVPEMQWLEMLLPLEMLQVIPKTKYDLLLFGCVCKAPVQLEPLCQLPMQQVD